MKHFASADAIARAVVAACRITGADPLELFLAPKQGVRGDPMSRARYYAFEALRVAVPGCMDAALARGLGFLVKGSVVAQKLAPRRPGWWSEEALGEIVGAVLTAEIGEGAEAPAPEEPIDLPRLPKPARRAGPALHMGEPEAGRSALDKRRAGIVEDEDDPITDGGMGSRSIAARRAVSLPRLKFLEKDF